MAKFHDDIYPKKKELEENEMLEAEYAEAWRSLCKGWEEIMDQAQADAEYLREINEQK